MPFPRNPSSSVDLVLTSSGDRDNVKLGLALVGIVCCFFFSWSIEILLQPDGGCHNHKGLRLYAPDGIKSTKNVVSLLATTD
jgi:hypothetical protein